MPPLAGTLLALTLAVAGTAASPATPAATVTVLAAGDIASCTSSGDDKTAGLLDANSGTVLTLGDNVYPSGSASQFASCYDPTWGRYRSRTRPSAGNHDYMTAGAAAYFAYFGAVAGDPAKGWYAFDRGDWRIYALNSNCSQVGGCGLTSTQARWLQADLARNPRKCVLAYWHHARFSSGYHGNSTAVRPFWQLLYDAGAELVLVGHDHDYERFAPQDPWGMLDRARGIRQIVVGTGGAGLRPFTRAPIANSRVRNADTHGIVRVTLGPSGYAWKFLPVAGKTFTDSGETACH